jgi:hypothetical protein
LTFLSLALYDISVAQKLNMKPRYYEDLEIGEVFVFSSFFSPEEDGCLPKKMNVNFPEFALEEVPFRKQIGESLKMVAVRQLWNKNIYLQQVAPRQVVYALGDEDSANAILEVVSLIEYFRKYRDYQDWRKQDFSSPATMKSTLFYCLREEKSEGNPRYKNLRIPGESNPRHIFNRGVLALEELYEGELDNLSCKKMFSWIRILSLQENLLWWMRSIRWADPVPLGDRFLTTLLFELGQRSLFRTLTEFRQMPESCQSAPYILSWEKKRIGVRFTDPYIQEDSTVSKWFVDQILKDTKVRLENEGINLGLLRFRSQELQAIAQGCGTVSREFQRV